MEACMTVVFPAAAGRQAPAETAVAALAAAGSRPTAVEVLLRGGPAIWSDLGLATAAAKGGGGGGRAAMSPIRQLKR